MKYQLFWDEEKQVYHLQDQQGMTLGILQDDTKFANQVLHAFEAIEELRRLKDRAYYIEEQVISLLKDIKATGITTK